MSERRRVVYLCMWTGESGGIQVLYEHVRLLRAIGIDAVLGAHGPFRRCTWFDNDPAQTPGISDVLGELIAEDVLVIPEICVGAPELDDVPARRIAFVQNPDLLGGTLDRYNGAIVPAQVLVPWLRLVSGFSGDTRVVPGFLHRQFVRPQRCFTTRKPRVLIVERPDKHRGEPARVRDLLRQTGAVDVTFMDRAMPRDQFAALFGEHDIYLHLSYPEGFPISVLEAFGAGCLVAGYSGRGGLEFMDDGHNCFVVPDGDCEAVVAAVRRVLDSPRDSMDLVLGTARTRAESYREEQTSRELGRVFASDFVGDGG